jgi:hypothetical protein
MKAISLFVLYALSSGPVLHINGRGAAAVTGGQIVSCSIMFALIGACSSPGLTDGASNARLMGIRSLLSCATWIICITAIKTSICIIVL